MTNEKATSKRFKRRAFSYSLAGFRSRRGDRPGRCCQARHLRRRNPSMRRLRETRRGPEPAGCFHALSHCFRRRLTKEESHGTARDGE